MASAAVTWLEGLRQLEEDAQRQALHGVWTRLEVRELYLLSKLMTGGLRVGVIGLANLSSLNSIFDTGNRLGVAPMDAFQTAQCDCLEPYLVVTRK